MSILNATHRDSVCSVVGAVDGTDVVEVEEARNNTANRTAPIVAGATNIAERTIAVVAVARKGQF